MDQAKTRFDRVNNLIETLKTKLQVQDKVMAFILSGSYSESSDSSPTQYSDVDLEVVLKDEEYDQFLANMCSWFEQNIEEVLIETKIGDLQKIFVTNDFVDLQFHLTKLSSFELSQREGLNYFPNGYTLLFDKTDSLEEKIKQFVTAGAEKTLQQKLDRINNAFWYVIQGTAPYIKRKEYWFGAAGYWAWLYVALCTLLRIYYKKEVKYNPMKHIEQVLCQDVIKRIEPLRNLETPDDLKSQMKLLIEIYSEYAHKIAEENNLEYNQKIEDAVRKRVTDFLK